MPNSRKIVFHHLTKTAGTSIISELQRSGLPSYNNARYDFEWNDEAFQSDEYQFFHGHYTFDLIKEISQNSQDLFLFTFLRNPIDRVISQYYNWKDIAKTTAEYEQLQKRGAEKVNPDIDKIHYEISEMRLEDFLRSENPKIVDSKYNHQTRYLSSRESRDKGMNYALYEACSNIYSKYEFFGIKELYSRSCKYLEEELMLEAHTLNAKYKTNVSKAKNRIADKYHISQEAYDLIVTNNLYDIKLYHFALGVFVSRYRLKNLDGILENVDSGYRVV